VNDLIRRKDENGKTAGGMFDQNRRVRAQTLRGEKSMGFYCPLNYLHKLEVNLYPDDERKSAFTVGQVLDIFRGADISKKYVTPTNQMQQGAGKQGKAKK
jgi:hypothetical protein